MARARKRKTSKKKSSGVSLFVLGVLVGAISTALTYGVMEDRPSDIGAGIDSLIDLANTSRDTTGTQGEPDHSETKSSPKLQFGYHEFLLEDEYVLPQPAEPEPEPQTQTAKTSKPEEPEPPAPQPTEVTASPKASSYVLQVGSFNNFKDADAVKVNLALQGQQAFIQKVTVEDRGVFYRVRVGPFDQLNAVNETSVFLKSIGYPPLRFRIKN